MAEEDKREIVAKKRGAQKQYLVYGCVIAVLAAFAAASAAFNAERGAGLIAFGIILALLAGGFAAYCFVLYFAQKKLPEALIYAEGDSLYCYQYRKKEYVRISLSEIVGAEGGITAREVHAGLLRVKTPQKTYEVAEIAEPFAAREEIARLKAQARERTP